MKEDLFSNLWETRRKADKELKQLLLSDSDLASRIGLSEEISVFNEMNRKGLLLMECDSVDSGADCLTDMLAYLDFAKRKKICLAICNLFARLHSGCNTLKPGVVRLSSIHFCFGKDGKTKIQLKDSVNFQFGPLVHTWEMTASDDKHFCSGLPVPMTDEAQNLANFRLIFRILAARENNIPENLNEYVKSRPTPEVLKNAVLAGKIPNIYDLKEMVSDCEEPQQTAPEVVSCAAEIGRNISTGPLEVIYCLVPSKAGPQSLQELRIAQQHAKKNTKEFLKRGWSISETFIMPGDTDKMYIIKGKEYDPGRYMDIPEPTKKLNYPDRSITYAMAMIQSSDSSRKFVLYLIGSDFLPTDTSGGGSILDKNIKDILCRLLGMRGALYMANKNGLTAEHKGFIV